MSNEISLEYGDVLKAYQSKSSELLTQLITAEAKLNASAVYVTNLQAKISELEKEIQKYQKSSTTKAKKTASDEVIDYNT
jgi:hypothetical protein